MSFFQEGARKATEDKLVNTPDNLDGISSISWSPRKNLLVASSWDSRVMCWEISSRGESQPKAFINHDGPVLCTAFSGDGTRVFSGGVDTFGKMWVLGQNKPSNVAKHDSPIRHIRYCPEFNILATGGWDKKVLYWDLRQQKPALTMKLPERCYAMDSLGNLLVVGCAGRDVCIYDLKTPNRLHKSERSTLKNQIRCVKCFPNTAGYAAGSICGRVSISYLRSMDEKKNFMFKCHRHRLPNDSSTSQVYAINSIEFHPRGTFATAGSDGQFVFWDKDSRQRLKKFEPRFKNSISCAGFNGDGSIFAYAVSYDWSQGMSNYKDRTNKIYLHAVKPGEVAPQRRR